MGFKVTRLVGYAQFAGRTLFKGIVDTDGVLLNAIKAGGAKAAKANMIFIDKAVGVAESRVSYMVEKTTK